MRNPVITDKLLSWRWGIATGVLLYAAFFVYKYFEHERLVSAREARVVADLPFTTLEATVGRMLKADPRLNYDQVFRGISSDPVLMDLLLRAREKQFVEWREEGRSEENIHHRFGAKVCRSMPPMLRDSQAEMTECYRLNSRLFAR